MKRLYLFIIVGLFLLCCLCMVASAYSVIRYNRGTAATYYDTLTWYGDVNNSIFYAADQAGVRVLHSAVKTSYDTYSLSLNKPLSPTDEYVMGGDKRDLWINISRWKPTTLTSVNVLVNGTNITGGFQQQNFTFTSNGTQYFTGLYKTLDTVKISKWVGTASPGVLINISQDKWGVIWKFPNTNTYMYTCTFICNGSAARQSFWNMTNFTCVFVPRSTSIVVAGSYVTFQWGKQSSTGNSRWGGEIFLDRYDSTALSFFTMSSTSSKNSNFRFYDTDFHGRRGGSGSSPFVLGTNNLSMIGCTMDGGFSITSGGNATVRRCNFGSSGAAIGGFSTPVDIDDLLLADVTAVSSARCIYLTVTGGFIGENITIKNSTNLARCFNLNDNVIRYLRNSKTNTLIFAWAGTSVGNPRFYMQYGLKGVVKANDTDAVISGAIVKVYEKNQTSAYILKKTITSGADGTIGYTWINRSFWKKNDVKPHANYTVRLEFSKAGYNNSFVTMQLNAETNLTFVLMKNKTCAECGASGVSGFSVCNPNPANGTMGFNYLQANPNGIVTSVDVLGNTNFTELTEANLGTGTIIEEQKSIETPMWCDHNYRGQTVLINSLGGNSKFLLTKFYGYMEIDGWGNPYSEAHIDIYNTDALGFPTGNILFNSSMRNISEVVSWVAFNFSNNFLLENNTLYAFILNITLQHNNDFVWWNNLTDNYTFGHHVYKNAGVWQNEFTPTCLSDFTFVLSGWSIPGNISWDHTLNQTWSSNSSGVWVPYAHTIAVSNSTQSVLNTNFTDNDTRYWWRVATSNSSGVEVGNMTVTFSTAARKQIIPFGTSSNHLSMGVAVGVMFGGLGGVVLMGSRRRRRQDAMFGGRV